MLGDMDSDSMKGEIEMGKNTPAPGAFAHWRLEGIGLLRILFGVVWGFDAWFKWQPDFVNNFATYVTGAQDGQPWPIHHWIQFWVNTIGIDPTLFAYAVAVGETAIAIALIIGAFTNLTALVGVLLSVVIWSTAEGFGGPYNAGSTDIGAAIIYPLVFAACSSARRDSTTASTEGSPQPWGASATWLRVGSPKDEPLLSWASR